MDHTPLQPVACSIGSLHDIADAAFGRAVFTLSRPIAKLPGCDAAETRTIGMRAFGTDDLPLLDRFIGQPVALVQNVIALLCDIPVECVQALELDDFTMLAADALFQVEQVSLAMGLPADFFILPHHLGESSATPS